MISIELFGPIRVSCDGQPCTGLSFKQRQILGILALSPGMPVPREQLADQLWEGSPPASYVGTLDSYVCVLRRALGLAAGRSSALATTAAGFVLEFGDDVEIDLNWFYRLARAADARTGRPALEWAEEAVALTNGVLLSEVPYAGWAVRAREEFTRTFVDLSMRGAQRANGLGEYARASTLARAAVARDPVCEDAWRQLMLAHWFSGSRGQALAAYAEFRTAMMDYLGDEPGQESQDLYMTILRAGSETSDLPAQSSLPHIRTLLTLLRQELELAPGVRPPALDAQLSEVAIQVLQTSGH
jgi:DNA-binding SARP family transcriptional activator